LRNFFGDPISSSSFSEVVIESWLMKRGEHIKTWRPRYFVLFKDGALLGYKNRVENFGEPLNVFIVKTDIQVIRNDYKKQPAVYVFQLMKVEKPKANTFLIRGLQWTTVIERMQVPKYKLIQHFRSRFYAESAELREKWISAVKKVSENLKSTCDDQEMIDVNNVPMADFSYGNQPGGSPSQTVAEAGAKQMFEEMRANSIIKQSKHQGKSQQASTITLDHFEFLKVLGRGKVNV
jgi:RAC serine/threonine-protein kinase